MSWEPGLDSATAGPCGPWGWRQGPHDRAPAAVRDLQPDAAVLVLLDPPLERVLLARKKCGGGRWGCDAALPGGHLEQGEGPVEAALREAWEEAWIHPSAVRVACLAPLHSTVRGGVIVQPVVAIAVGPLCPRPSSGELDRVFWVSLVDVTGIRPGRVAHPRGFKVEGILLPDGTLVWGLTLRILTWLASALPTITAAPRSKTGARSKQAGG